MIDRRRILDAAAETFARHGYEGASISDLATAMQISPQSLYAAFGSKAALYAAALDWYADEMGAVTDDALDRPDVVTTLCELLEAEAHRFAAPGRVHGCLISTGAIGCAVENDEVALQVAARREATIARVARRLVMAADAGELKAEENPIALARFFGAMLQGMSVQARDGVSEDELLALARVGTVRFRAARPRH